MNKFKKGDRVVRIMKNPVYNIPVGSAGTVQSVDEYNRAHTIFDDHHKAGVFKVSEDRLILESVYNSPLYQALK